MKPIQMALCQNQKVFSQFCFEFPESTWNLEYFEKKDDPSKLFFSEIIHYKKRGYLNEEKPKCLKSYGMSTC